MCEERVAVASLAFAPDKGAGILKSLASLFITMTKDQLVKSQKTNNPPEGDGHVQQGLDVPRTAAQVLTHHSHGVLAEQPGSSAGTHAASASRCAVQSARPHQLQKHNLCTPVVYLFR